ncbi:TetR/AcrR family transcriptional regulator [Paenibacillus dokdonensis]|uniref:TetR/AcrR family transcriptional regulator n=1 Tax=Paenibacillus dokdonensis TaxID=2567944 RepID=A0ABU6GQ87_9BACL|nr:TetR/AcrR family transcriptional regulator [Paenibacillus dokdonensis]MEC0241921.1 TetR/AcrR family transcriptional regulator [Paenibacillus dokdonensis]
MNKGEITKQRIIEQARDLFSKTGYDATKTSAIAKACGISEAAMYKYFSSKKELLEASVVIDFASEPSAAADFSQYGNEQLVEYYINRLITTIQENMEQFNILFTESLHHPELSDYFDRSVYRKSAEVQEMQKRIQEGMMNPIMDIFLFELGTTTSIWSILHYDRMKLGREDGKSEQFRKEVIRFVKYGVMGTGSQEAPHLR